MIKKRIISFCLVVVILLFSACANQQENVLTAESKPRTETIVSTEDKDNTKTMIYAYINDTKVKILPEDNSSATAFVDLLSKDDLVIEMHDYANFEKVGSLGTTLPSNDERITTQAGDVILYQGSFVTIYYDTNTWNFTRLGKIQDLTADELVNLLGDGDVTVKFSLH